MNKILNHLLDAEHAAEAAVEEAKLLLGAGIDQTMLGLLLNCRNKAAATREQFSIYMEQSM